MNNMCDLCEDNGIVIERLEWEFVNFSSFAFFFVVLNWMLWIKIEYITLMWKKK